MSPNRLLLALPLALVVTTACDEKAAAVPDAPPSGAESGNAEAEDEAEAKGEAPAEAEPAKEAEGETAEPAEAAGEPTDEKAGTANAAPTPAQADPAKPDVVAKTDPSTAKTAETIPIPPATDKPPADKKKPGAIVAGQRATAVASVKADEGYKCNDEFPHKFTAKGGSNVDYPSEKVSGSCAGAKAVSVSVPYTPKAAGPGTVAGELKYGICDDAKTNCRIMKKAVTLSFNAEAN